MMKRTFSITVRRGKRILFATTLFGKPEADSFFNQMQIASVAGKPEVMEMKEMDPVTGALTLVQVYHLGA